MSIEFTCLTREKLVGSERELVLDYILNHSKYRIMREIGDEYGFGLSQGDGLTLIENISVIFEPTSMYVAFHAASRNQRELFLKTCQEALASCNLEGNFEEL